MAGQVVAVQPLDRPPTLVVVVLVHLDKGMAVGEAYQPLIKAQAVEVEQVLLGLTGLVIMAVMAALALRLQSAGQ
jgi:hypothetical protein